MKQLINDYYFLCSLLDDNIEMLAGFLKYKNLTKHRKSMLIIFFENLRLKNVEKEIDLEIKNLNSEIDNIFKEKEKEILKI